MDRAHNAPVLAVHVDVRPPPTVSIETHLFRYGSGGWGRKYLRGPRSVQRDSATRSFARAISSSEHTVRVAFVGPLAGYISKYKFRFFRFRPPNKGQSRSAPQTPSKNAINYICKKGTFFWRHQDVLHPMAEFRLRAKSESKRNTTVACSRLCADGRYYVRSGRAAS